MTGGPGSGERFPDGGEGNEFPRRSRRHGRTSDDERFGRSSDAPSSRPHPTDSHALPYATGRHPLAHHAEPPQDDTESWRRVVEEARAAQADPPGPWPTRVSGFTALGAVALVVLAAVLAVVGLPRFLSSSADNKVYHSTALRLPADVARLPRVGKDKVTPEDKRSAQHLLAAVRFPLQTSVGVYAQPTGIRLTVVTGRPAKPIPEADIASLRDGFTAGMKTANVQVREIGPGQLGGWFGCAQLEHGQTLCLAMDAGAVVSISVTSKDPSAIALATAARSAVEHRTPSS